jgi:hypothetical protein
MQSDSDEEFNRFCNAPLEERERLRAEREAAHGPELSPITEWPEDEEYIPVWGAARLLQIAFSPPALLPKPNNSQLGRELIRIVTDRERDNNMQEILRWAREGRIHLIHPTLRIPMPRHPDPGPDWFMDKKTFEHVKNALANGHEPAVLPEPAVIEATVPSIDEAGVDADAGGETPVTGERQTDHVAADGETPTGSQAGTGDPKNNDLKPAGDGTIAAAMTQAYDEAGDERPNVNEIVKPVKEILRKKGYKASKKLIQEVADRPEYKSRRRPVGEKKRGIKQTDFPK